VREVKPIRGPGRREIGHGALAERSIEVVLPEHDSFPYTIRVVSDILESNGSSSMATVCGTTLALMDAGVKIRRPVAGIAMGLVTEGDRHCILSDILGTEDHCGDMDFKVAGTQNGITGLQMDIKMTGVPYDVMAKALDQARIGRLSILRTMLKSLSRPRDEISRLAPKTYRVTIPRDKIGMLIGPGGKNIRRLQEETESTIDVQDDGTVTIFSVSTEGAEKARHEIELLGKEAQVGDVYKGKVISVKDFGCFLELWAGTEALCHISELSDGYLERVEDAAKIGDELEVKVIAIDDAGRVKVSRKAVLMGEAYQAPDDSARRGGRGDDRRGGRGGRNGDRGGRGGRNGDRGGRGRR
jgi:polyribonucleotide nucleotidyltransferase